MATQLPAGFLADPVNGREHDVDKSPFFPRNYTGNVQESIV